MIDWGGFFPGVIETFIGVLVALFFQKIYEDLKDMQEAKKQKVKIKKELIEIYEDLTQIQKNNIIALNPIKMPIFLGLVNSTKISLLDRYLWYDEMLSVYNDLSTYNSWCEFRLTSTNEENVKVADNIIKVMEEKFIGKKKEKGSCQCNACTIYSTRESEKINLEGTINCLITKVGVTDKSDCVKKFLFFI